MIKPTAQEQKDILEFTRTNLNDYESQSEVYRDQMLNIYSHLSTFTEPNTGENLPRFKLNVMHIILRQLVPRLIANSPRPMVSVRTDAFQDDADDQQGQDRLDMLEENDKMARAFQDYLTKVFNQENMRERLKYWVVNQLTYGNAFAQVIPKYKIKKSKKSTTKGQKITEDSVEVMPSIDIISWSEMYYDPRYKIMEDMPGYFRVRKRVRIRDLFFAKNSEGKPKYFNLDEVEKLAGVKYDNKTQYEALIHEITGVEGVNPEGGLDKNALDVQTYYGFYTLTGSARDEREYEITTLNDSVVIGIEEITEKPIVDIKGHEDPEIFPAVGVCAPIIGQDDELNFKKNARALATSQALNRSYFIDANSGVDPSQLVGDEGGKIIYTSSTTEQAMKSIQEIEHKPLDASYFSDVNDIWRDVQKSTHTIDVTQPQGQTNLTNTATGAKISANITDAVIDELRKNFERGVQELGYKIAEWALDNLEETTTLKGEDGKFFTVDKEVFRNALERYEIKIEANSSSFDSVDERRANAIAIKNIMLEGKQAGLNVELEEGFKNLFGTFENVNPDELIKPEEESIDTILAGFGELGDEVIDGETVEPTPALPQGL